MRARKGSMLEVTIGDGAGATLTLTFFNQAWRERDLRRGRWGLFAGKVTEFRGKRQLNGPAYQLLRADATEDEAAEEIEEFAGALIPVYPAAAGRADLGHRPAASALVLDTFEPPADPLPGSRARQPQSDRHRHRAARDPPAQLQGGPVPARSTG